MVYLLLLTLYRPLSIARAIYMDLYGWVLIGDRYQISLKYFLEGCNLILNPHQMRY